MIEGALNFWLHFYRSKNDVLNWKENGGWAIFWATFLQTHLVTLNGTNSLVRSEKKSFILKNALA
jgi:hypothetical protein